MDTQMVFQEAIYTPTFKHCFHSYLAYSFPHTAFRKAIPGQEIIHVVISIFQKQSLLGAFKKKHLTNNLPKIQQHILSS